MVIHKGNIDTKHAISKRKRVFYKLFYFTPSKLNSGIKLSLTVPPS